MYEYHSEIKKLLDEVVDKNSFIFDKNEFKNCIEFYKNEISIPIYYGLSINQINFIVKNILEIDKLK